MSDVYVEPRGGMYTVSSRIAAAPLPAAHRTPFASEYIARSTTTWAGWADALDHDAETPPTNAREQALV